MQEDWVFASPTMKGEQPYWPDNLMKRYIKPVAKANGIYKNIGWHTFRHTTQGEWRRWYRSFYGTRTAGSHWMSTHRQ